MPFVSIILLLQSDYCSITCRRQSRLKRGRSEERFEDSDASVDSHARFLDVVRTDLCFSVAFFLETITRMGGGQADGRQLLSRRL